MRILPRHPGYAGPNYDASPRAHFMTHLHEHISCNHEDRTESHSSGRRPFLHLIRAIRRNSTSLGIYSPARVNESAFDLCCNWPLYDYIADEQSI